MPHIGHSVKPLPSVTSALGKKKSDVNSDGLFAECHLSDTRQRIFSFFLKILCRVPYSCTRQRKFFFLKKKSLPSAMALALGQLCRVPWSRHSAKPSLPSVALGKEGENAFFLGFFAFHQHKQRNHIYINTQHMIYHIHIHIPSHTHP